ncbi:SIR2 family NAD-dependent protein deacylase [Andreprevotia lacus]|uniref:SIR2 family NAD-dependent protein deacylase n=1 Tax=Andreprevotia lacus TaxID=1121000 RepID=UPI00159442BD|nr:Sir2 family NAD-dependent protein deacetylase [Andreprevotia lacus]
MKFRSFYGHRLKLYRETVPHAGFAVLHAWGEQLHHGAFVFTSNVDGQFQKAGFTADRVVECHGSIHHVQCVNGCNKRIDSADAVQPLIDDARCHWLGELPHCPDCGGLLRPNILMFGDSDWLSRRTDLQYGAMNRWLAGVGRLVIVELGAGSTIATVRYTSEHIARQLAGVATLIRINPTEAEGPDGCISLASGALAGLTLIAEALAEV